MVHRTKIDDAEREMDKMDFFIGISEEIERSIEELSGDSSQEANFTMYQHPRHSYQGLRERMDTLRILTKDARFTIRATQGELTELGNDYQFLLDDYNELAGSDD